MALNSYRLLFGQLEILPNDQSIIAVLIGLLRRLDEPKFLLFEPNDFPPSDGIIAILIGLLRGLKPGGIGVVQNGGKMTGFEANLIQSLRKAGLPVQEERSGAPGLGTLLVVHPGGWLY